MPSILKPPMGRRQPLAANQVLTPQNRASVHGAIQRGPLGPQNMASAQGAVQYASAGQPSINGPQIYEDYNRIGLSPPPLNQIEQGRQTRGFYQGIGGGQTSGISSMNGGYFTPEMTSQIPRQQFTPGQAMDQGAQHNNLDSRWAMQYPQGMLRPRGAAPQEQPVASMQEGRFQVGQRFGNSEVMQMPDGRKVVVGDGSRLGDVPQVRPRIGLDTGGKHKSMSQVDYEIARQQQIGKQDDRRESLAAGRNIRTNRMYGAPLRPDLFPRASARYAPQQEGGEVPTSPAPGGPLSPPGLASVPNNIESSLGINPEGATVDDLAGAYNSKKGNFSAAERESYKKYLQKRLNDDEEFKNDFMRDFYSVEPDGSLWGAPRVTQDTINARNEQRKLLGLPPLKPKVEARKWYE